MRDYVLEICVDNIESAYNAERGGADRVELCQALEVGGVTPSTGLVKVAKRELSIPVFMLVRPRAGNFEYTALEVSQMEEDIKNGLALGVDGFVTGALRDGKVDKETCRRLLKAAGGLPVTFHRAFDVINYPEVLEDIINLGFKRILTSGRATTAINGIRTIKSLVEKAGQRITIMPAASGYIESNGKFGAALGLKGLISSGISERNLLELMSYTKASEYHSSAQGPLKMYLGEAVVRGTTSFPLSSSNVVKAMKHILST